MKALVALAAVAGLVLASPAHAATTTVESGPLRAVIASDPWRVTFTDASGKTVLQETALAGSSAHAVKAVQESGGASGYSATLATDDPLGAQIHVRIAPDADGVLALTATADRSTSTSISFAARPGERYLGFGERSNAVDQRGGVVENYVSDGPYLEPERPLVAGFVPPQGYHPRDDATYFPVPWLLSTNGYGVLVDNSDRSQFDLTGDPWTATVDAGELRLRVFAGPTPAAALARFSARVGRQPPAAAPFFFGPWFQPAGGDQSSIDTLQKADAPASVMQTYTHYLPCGDQQGKTDDQRKRTAAGHAAGYAVTTYFNPMICTGYTSRYDEAAARGYLTKNVLGQPYQYRYTGSTQFLVSQFDFTAPGASAFYGDLLREAVGDGYDGWMEDFGEYTPTDSVSADGTPGPAMHNLYPTLYHRAANDFSRAAGRPLARFNRSGWTGAARESQIVWGGDPSTDFGFDGLTSAVRQALSIGTSGVSIWGSDIGGYFTLAAPQLTPELLKRWIEFGSVSGVMRTEATGFALPGKGTRPEIFDPDVLPVWRRYAKLRTQLYPYLAAAERDYDRTGLPLMRQLALVFPADPAAVARDDEFMLGPDLLAAPVLEAGATTRKLYLPGGRWVDLWRAITLAPDGSPRLGRTGTTAGRRELTLAAPLDQIPLLARAGTVLPLLPSDVDTLTTYGSARGLVHLRDRANRLRLLAFPRGRTRASIGTRESVASTESHGSWTLTVRGTRTRTYSLQASLQTLRRPFAACAVTLNGRPLARRSWSYRLATGVLRAKFRARSARLTAAQCRVPPGRGRTPARTGR